MRHALAFAALCLALLCSARAAQAQTTVPSPTPSTTRLAWDHAGVNITGFALVVDGVRTVIAPTPAPMGSTYSVPFPALSPGAHTLAVDAFNAAGSTRSTALSVTVIVAPTPATNIRIITTVEPTGITP